MATRVKFCRKLFNDDTLANVSDSFCSSDGTVYRTHDTDSRRTCRRYPVSIQQVTVAKALSKMVPFWKAKIDLTDPDHISWIT